MSNVTAAEFKRILTPVDRSTKSLSTAADALSKASADLATNVAALTKQQIDLVEDIEFKTSELNSLAQKLTEAERAQQAELNLRVKENEDKVRAELLKKAGTVEVKQTDINVLTAERDAAVLEAQQTERKAVQEAVASVKLAHQNELQTVTSDHAVAIARHEAKAEQDAVTIRLYKEQAENAQKTLEEERKARILIEEARSKAAGVTVQTGNSK